MVMKFIESDHIYIKAIKWEYNMQKKNAETCGPKGDLMKKWVSITLNAIPIYVN